MRISISNIEWDKEEDENVSQLLCKYNIDAIDIEIDNNNPEAIIETIKNIGGTFGGINLEDIAAPDCFIIEQKLKDLLDIPIFHDDQHGTAIITTAALINALDISKK